MFVSDRLPLLSSVSGVDETTLQTVNRIDSSAARAQMATFKWDFWLTFTHKEGLGQMTASCAPFSYQNILPSIFNR
jgi:hypothetical protein